MPHPTAFHLRHSSSPFYEEDFYLDHNRIPFFHTNALLVSAYGESFLRPGAQIAICHPYWAISYVSEGRALLIGENIAKSALRTDDLVILRPGPHYQYLVPPESIFLRKVLLINNGQMISTLLNQGPLAGVEVFHLRDAGKIKLFFERVRKLVTEGAEDLQKQLSILTYEFLLNVLEQAGPHSIRGDFNGILASIEQNLAEDLSLKSLSAKYGIGARTLNRLFLEHLHVSPIQYIIRMRMKYAAELLLSDFMSIRAVSEACGYKNFSFFSREFRKSFGMTPREYREKNLVNDSYVKKKFAQIQQINSARGDKS